MPANRQAVPTDVEPILVPDRVACALVGISRASWWRLFSAGKTPVSVRLGRRRLFNRSQVILWAELGCRREPSLKPA